MNIELAESNIQKFMNRYGIEGFLKLYFAKYLLKLLKSELKSKMGSEISIDPGVIFHYKGQQIEKLCDIHEYEGQLFEECKKKADEIITQFKKDKKFNDLFKGNLEKLNDPLLEKCFEKKLHEILEEWKGEN
jgi:hypothetical protein